MNRGEVEAWFQDLIHQTRHLLEGAGDDHFYPVDVYEILPDFWDEWFNPMLEAWTPQVSRDLRECSLGQMELHPGDIAVRYTALAAYDGLIQYLTSPFWAECLPPNIASPIAGVIGSIGGRKFASFWSKPDIASLREDFQSVLRFVKIDDIAEWSEIQWEISNSCLVEDWDRVFRLYDRAWATGLLDEGDLRLMTAQFRFCLAFRDTLPAPLQEDIRRNVCVRKGNLILHPCNWEPQLYDSPDSPWSLLFFASGLVVSTENPEPVALDRHLLRDTVDALEQAGKHRELPAPYGAALARCYYAAGRFYDAAAQYERLLGQELPGAWALLSPHVYRAVASSYESAEEPRKAIIALQVCTSKFPTETDIYLRTAELQAREADYLDVKETIRKATDSLPGLGEDWRYSSLLALGEIHPPHRAVLSVEMVPPGHRDLIISLLDGYWPRFTQLCDKAREEWITGTYFLIPANQQISEAVARNARLSLVKALDLELAAKVFRPACEYFLKGEDLQRLIKEELERGGVGKRDQDPSLFCQFVSRRKNLTFGQKSTILSLCARPESPVFTALREWLWRNHSGLVEHASRLDRVAKFRNRAEHEGISLQGSEGIAEECRKVIESIR